MYIIHANVYLINIYVNKYYENKNKTVDNIHLSMYHVHVIRNKTTKKEVNMTATVITTNVNLEDNAKVIKSLESKIAELKELRDEKIAEVKDIMNQANVMELTAGAFTFKLTEITRNNVDTKTLKTKYAELYKALLKVSSYMKFDIV